ncbi:hypothetical protein [Pontibacter fetidus]|uniref:Uncharacterized protein n=1 Tax=Pontibacter fetidus TaxID=2700082 RepID=A0A6B2HBQ0_9BACT|nr:hypothetical protein [Pontibacter fetidus]NDK57362.1 hypothetical protein [Pontibacter fetidus]
MNFINKMIVALYQREQINMQYSGGTARLFIAKLVFCLLIWIWLLPILGILENNLNLIEISFEKPSTKWGYVPILIILYLALHYFTWKVKEVDEFIENEENIESIKSAKRLFFILLVIGFVFLIAVAKYNQGNPLSD